MKQLKQDKLTRNFTRRSAGQSLLDHHENQSKPLINYIIEENRKLYAKGKIVFETIINQRLTKNQKANIVSQALFEKE